MNYLKYYEGLSSDRELINDFFNNENNFSSLGGRITYRINRIGLKNFVDVSGSINIEVALDNFPFRFGRIDGDFIINYNNLVTLKGCPNYVGGDFNCRANELVSLDGCPSYVGGNFDCSYNELVSLDGCPSVIGGVFNCNGNKLVSSFSGLVGCSRLHCEGTLLYNIWKLFSDVSKLELFNDYDIIRGDSVVLDRLNGFLVDIGKDPVNGVEGYKNI